MMRKNSMVFISGLLLLLVFCQNLHAEEVNRLTAGKNYYVIEKGAFEFDAGVDYQYISNSGGIFGAWWKVTNDIWVGRLALSYAPTDRVDIGIEVPYVYREWEVKSNIGINLDKNDGDIGDISCSLQWQILEEDRKIPALILKGRVLFPTGKSPYDNDEGELKVPTGTGYYSTNTGLYLSKSVSSLLFFGGGFFQYNFNIDDPDRKEFDGILDEVDPGNQYGFEIGTGYAVHENVAIQIAYSRIETDDFRFSYRNAPSASESRPAESIAGAGFGWRFAGNQLLSLKTGFGLNDDSPDLILSLRYAVLF